MILRLWLFLACFLPVTIAFSAEQISKAMPFAYGKQIEIDADQIIMAAIESKITCRGNVKIKQGEVTLNADTVVITYAKTKNSLSLGNASIETITASGHVIMKDIKNTINSDNAVYNMNKNNIIFSGNVLISDSGNIINGDTLRINLNNNQSILTSDSQVHGILTPKAKSN